MWLFLATEVMFFGGLLTAYAVYRTTSPTGGRAREQRAQCRARVHQYGRPPGKQPDDGHGRPRRRSCGRSAELVMWLVSDDGSWERPSSGSRRSSGPTIITNIRSRGLNFQVPEKDRAESSNKKAWIRERWRCFLFFTSS